MWRKHRRCCVCALVSSPRDPPGSICTCPSRRFASSAICENNEDCCHNPRTCTLCPRALDREEGSWSTSWSTSLWTSLRISSMPPSALYLQRKSQNCSFVVCQDMHIKSGSQQVACCLPRGVFRCLQTVGGCPPVFSLE